MVRSLPRVKEVHTHSGHPLCHSRVRKTRCDGAKPICFNCRKRPPEDGEECSYEEQPKRRGQDKVPGLRVRCSSHGPRKRKRTGSDDSEEEAGESSLEEDYGPRLHASYQNFPRLSAVSSDVRGDLVSRILTHID